MREYEQLTLDMGLTNDLLPVDKPEEKVSMTLPEKIEKAKTALKLSADMSKEYYHEPLIIAYSGGKDSDVLLHLAESCLKPNEFEVLNGHTTVDAPQTVHRIRETFKRLNEKGVKTTIDYHKKEDGTNETMWSLIIRKDMPPTRLVRYCCQVLKETTTPNRICALGVRAAESSKRQGRDTFVTRGGRYADALFFSLDHALEVHQESKEIQDEAWDCTLIKNMKEHKETLVNPIYEWTDGDVWEYINQNHIDVNPLYAMGYKRIGCLGCPLATHAIRVKEFNDFPKYKQMYINAFQKMIAHRVEKGLECKWKTGQEVFDWWMETYKYDVKGQYNLFDEDIYG